VTVGGGPAAKASRLVGPGEAVVVLGPGPRFVSRGGEKLDAALDRFGVDVTGRKALDAGASTGGFTDCLLQRGAAHVTAVDVGHGQFHPRLRGDGRVTVRERTNLRTYVAEEPFDVVVADLSFISLRTVAPALVGPNAVPGADVIVLVKPQFEAGRAEVSRGRGVVRDPAVWRRAVEDTAASFASHGAAMMGAMVSPLTGADGNVEFLLHLRAASESASGEAASGEAASGEAASGGTVAGGTASGGAVAATAPAGSAPVDLAAVVAAAAAGAG
jgi:23S rRNA (cytidine1920-2'-O)/16S rRNA (cytidine1409-2'-O)-methyltransferase